MDPAWAVALAKFAEPANIRFLKRDSMTQASPAIAPCLPGQPIPEVIMLKCPDLREHNPFFGRGDLDRSADEPERKSRTGEDRRSGMSAALSDGAR